MSNQRVAVLIDADNIPASLCDEALRKCEALGNITIKRAYGDFTKGTASSWQNAIIANGIEMSQNYNVAMNKNASDISLVIDAMDFLHNLQTDIFCVVSSDSDFTRLATRLTSCGRKIYGFGDSTKTSKSFQNACTHFHNLIIPTKTVTQKSSHQIAQKLNAGSEKPYLKAYNLIQKELKKITTGPKWINLDALGQQISKAHPKIKYSEYGGKTLTKVVKLVEETTLVKTKNFGTEKQSAIKLAQ